MKTKGKTLNEKHLEQVQANNPAVLYTPPQVEVIDIELSHNILTASLNDMPGEDWDDEW
ncbi:MAG: hypothetical protein QM305_04375 [Bacteroidota bacterium]|jgi:hypothetical protein|nr:hypothetical protein [Bacteroidota bacterium]